MEAYVCGRLWAITGHIACCNCVGSKKKQPSHSSMCCRYLKAHSSKKHSSKESFIPSVLFVLCKISFVSVSFYCLLKHLTFIWSGYFHCNAFCISHIHSCLNTGQYNHILICHWAAPWVQLRVKGNNRGGVSLFPSRFILQSRDLNSDWHQTFFFLQIFEMFSFLTQLILWGFSIQPRATPWRPTSVWKFPVLFSHWESKYHKSWGSITLGYLPWSKFNQLTLFGFDLSMCIMRS